MDQIVLVHAAEFMYAFMEVAHILIKWVKYRK